MRSIGVALLCTVAACYSPSYKDCEVSCSTGTCPAGLICDQGVCRTAGFSQACGALPDDAGMMDASIDGPPGDVDSDGVANAMDNCPNKSNATQANEDGDMFGDVCDPCPPFNGAADNMDSDGDGVGNSCDPSQASGGNAIVVFEGFREATRPPVVQIDGNWTFPGGHALVTNNSAVAHILHWPRAAGPGETILAKIVVDGIFNQPPVGIGVLTDGDFVTNPFTGVTCWVMKPTTASTGVLSLYHLNMNELGQRLDPLTVGVTYRTDLTRRGTNFTCNEPGAGGNLSGGTPISNAPDPRIGVMSIGVTARVEWVLIVSGI